MDKDQAEKSLAIIRSVIENTRDDLIERNWGVIWMVHSFINFAAAAGGAGIDRRDLPVYWYAVPLLAITLLNIIVVLVFMSREQGVRSYVEWQLWGIWITFLVFTCVAIITLHTAEIKPSFFAVIFAMNCGISFTMMGLVFYRRFLAIGAMFFAVSMAAAAWPSVQWWLIGAAWWLAMFIPGLSATESVCDGNNMNSEHESSSDAETAANETELAVLVACHHRGRVEAVTLSSLLPSADGLYTVIARLVAQGYLAAERRAYAITQSGRDYLDGVLEGIQSQLTPDDPAYERRFRQTKPSLPFAANTVWEQAICINVRVRPDALRPLIPAQFDLDMFDGWAYVSLTASRLKNFGAGNIPRLLRKNFYQATYRAHVTFTDFRGRRTRGCYFVRSETNSPIMSLTANLLPEFKAHRCSTYPILMARQGDHLLLSVDSGDDPAGKVVVVLNAAQPLDRMPVTSRFKSIDEAYDFIVDFYNAFSFDATTQEVFILGIDRGDWNIQVLEPVDHYLGYFTCGPFPPGTAELDSIFYFCDTPYRWLPLVKERIKTART